jgi:hypothetical protein
MMIRYLPNLDSLLWSLKSQEVFDSIADLRQHIADQRNAFYRYIGIPEKEYQPSQVELKHLHDRDPFMGWKNYCSVVLDGTVIGFCGE